MKKKLTLLIAGLVILFVSVLALTACGATGNTGNNSTGSYYISMDSAATTTVGSRSSVGSASREITGMGSVGAITTTFTFRIPRLCSRAQRLSLIIA